MLKEIETNEEEFTCLQSVLVGARRSTAANFGLESLELDDPELEEPELEEDKGDESLEEWKWESHFLLLKEEREK